MAAALPPTPINSHAPEVKGITSQMRGPYRSFEGLGSHDNPGTGEPGLEGEICRLSAGQALPGGAMRLDSGRGWGLVACTGFEATFLLIQITIGFAAAF